MENLYAIVFWIVLSILLIIIGTAKFKFHPALVLFSVSLIIAFGLGFSVIDAVRIISTGFGHMLANIGVLILLGCVLAIILEQLKSINYLSQLFIRFFGLKRPFLLLGSMGSLIGIPVFCDVAYIILSNFSKTLANHAKVSSVSTAITLASSLYIAHNLIPPTPGPLAVIGNLNASKHLGIVFLLGLIICCILIGIISLYARYISKHSQANDKIEHFKNIKEEKFNALIILPLLLPIFLIAIGSIVSLFNHHVQILYMIESIGNPIIALTIGIILGLFLLKKNLDHNSLIKKAIIQAGPILVITGFGGSYGQVIKESSFSQLLTETISIQNQEPIYILMFAYLMAFFIKTAQGSSTSAMIIVSAIIAPFISGSHFNTPTEIALLVLAIGSGSMMISHTNDSYFWVVTEFSGMNVKQSLKSFSLGTILLSISSLFLILLFFWTLGMR